ncbi:MAG: DUF707 domain-containing protein [Terracidiphilus sp.]|jgi:hypothetical protein
MKPSTSHVLDGVDFTPHHRNLVIVRSGEQSLHEQWLADPEKRNWDIVISYFGDDPNRYRRDDVIRVDAKGPKWTALYDLLQQKKAEILQYDFIWFPDDDLAADAQTINRMFAICAELQLHLAQPALSPDSYVTHAITVANHAFQVRYTNFVEIMAPIFSRSFLNQCAATFGENMSGYGLDTLWPTWCTEPRKIAIIDACKVRHTRPLGGPNYKAVQAWGGKLPDEELNVVLTKYGIVGFEQRIEGGIDLKGCLLSSDGQNASQLVETLIAGYLPEMSRHRDDLIRLLRPILRKMSYPALSQSAAQTRATIEQVLTELMEQEKLPEAVTLLKSAMAAGETSELWNDWGMVFLACGDRTRAEEGYRRAIELDALAKEPRMNLAALLAMEGRLDEFPPILLPIAGALTMEEKFALQKVAKRANNEEPTLEYSTSGLQPELPAKEKAAEQPHRELTVTVAAGIDEIILGKTIHERSESGWGYDLLKIAELSAAFESASYYAEHMSSCHIAQNDLDLLAFAAKTALPEEVTSDPGDSSAPGETLPSPIPGGLVLEFGVASGRTINFLAEQLPNRIVFGFDWFGGLPETWRKGLEKGCFAQPVPELRENVSLVEGLFEDTLPSFADAHHELISLLHVDCDLYGSTKSVFNYLSRNIVPGTIIVFDEYFNFPGWRNHEYKAFQEFISASGRTYEYIGFVPTYQQVCVRITAGTRSRDESAESFYHAGVPVDAGLSSVAGY